MTLEECYLSILKNSNSWNPTNSHTVEFDWGKMKFEKFIFPQPTNFTALLF